MAQIFDNLYQIKKLEIIRYNKNIKNKLNIKINNYKNESSRIEIEIIPKENEYGRFINIKKMKVESNYHIYFNDSKEKIERKELNEDDNVQKIKVILNYKIKSLYELFINCRVFKTIFLLRVY